MGDRYFLEMTCLKCGLKDLDVYFAPTCGFTEWKCKCGHTVDLVEFTGITAEMASNADEIKAMIAEIKR